MEISDKPNQYEQFIHSEHGIIRAGKAPEYTVKSELITGSIIATILLLTIAILILA